VIALSIYDESKQKEAATMLLAEHHLPSRWIRPATTLPSRMLGKVREVKANWISIGADRIKTPFSDHANAIYAQDYQLVKQKVAVRPPHRKKSLMNRPN